jgi:anti-sigma factor RsiW
MGHLGSRISAFVDGELPASARDHALAHCERCASCRRDVAVERWLKVQHRSMTPAEPSATLLGNLFAIGKSADLETSSERLLSELHRHEESLAPAAFPTAATGSYLASAQPLVPSRSHSAVLSDRGRAAGLVMAGAGSVTAAVFGLAYVLGGPASTARPAPVTPEVDQFSAEFTGTSDSLPFSDPAFGIYSAAFDSGRPGHR